VMQARLAAGDDAHRVRPAPAGGQGRPAVPSRPTGAIDVLDAGSGHASARVTRANAGSASSGWRVDCPT
jgi:hypothetical protein